MQNVLIGNVIPEKSYRYFDNTMLDAARRCDREYYLRHVKNWRRESISAALAFGLGWHAMQDILWLSINKVDATTLLKSAQDAFADTWAEQGMPDPRKQGALDIAQLEELYPRTPGRAAEMFVHYVAKYAKFLSEYEVMGLEIPFIIPLSEEFPDIFYCGRIDKIYRHNGRIFIVDHKTTKTEGPSWLDSFNPSGQMEGYSFAGRMTYGDAFDGVIVDGALVQKGTPASKKKQTDPDFPAGISFPRFPLVHHKSVLAAWHWETLQIIKTTIDFNLELLAECKPGDEILRAFPRKTSSCNNYGGCQFRDVCRVMSNPLRQIEPPPGFKEEKWEPFDLLDITKGQKEE